MKLHKSDFIGTGKVYRFSFMQMIKGKANVITLLIFILLAAAAVPIMASAGGGNTVSVLEEEMDIEEDFYYEIENSVQSVVMTEAEYFGKDNQGMGFDGLFAVQYGYSIFAMFICVFSSTYIIRSVIEEKASRLVETLMISVRPLALILGKILAVMTYIFGLFAAMILAAVASYFVCGQFMDVSGIGNMLANLGITAESMRLSFGSLVVILVSLAISYMTYSIISGISGTSCSTMEDVEGANLTVTLLIMSGYLISCVTVAIENPVVSILISLCPVVSTFCAPVQYVLGNISWVVLLGSWLIQVVILILLAVFCTRIYQDLILYKGTRLKWRHIFKMAKEVQS